MAVRAEQRDCQHSRGLRGSRKRFWEREVQRVLCSCIIAEIRILIYWHLRDRCGTARTIVDSRRSTVATRMRCAHHRRPAAESAQADRAAGRSPPTVMADTAFRRATQHPYARDGRSPSCLRSDASRSHDPSLPRSARSHPDRIQLCDVVSPPGPRDGHRGAGTPAPQSPPRGDQSAQWTFASDIRPFASHPASGH
ncbi:hypothetical protein C8Q77DRAFT_174537 [Trametes polyzona]|nr:hypothetical protein C8Q77DRAFT_174537 [Trametes polyzona]